MGVRVFRIEPPPSLQIDIGEVTETAPPSQAPSSPKVACVTHGDRPIEALAKRKRVLPHIVPAIIGMSQPPETLTDYLRFNSQAVYRVIAASSGVRSARNPWFFSSKLVKPSSDNAVRMRSLSGQPITSSSVYGLFVDDGP